MSMNRHFPMHLYDPPSHPPGHPDSHPENDPVGDRFCILYCSKFSIVFVFHGVLSALLSRIQRSIKCVRFRINIIDVPEVSAYRIVIRIVVLLILMTSSQYRLSGRFVS